MGSAHAYVDLHATTHDPIFEGPLIGTDPGPDSGLYSTMLRISATGSDAASIQAQSSRGQTVIAPLPRLSQLGR